MEIVHGGYIKTFKKLNLQPHEHSCQCTAQNMWPQSCQQMGIIPQVVYKASALYQLLYLFNFL